MKEDVTYSSLSWGSLFWVIYSLASLTSLVYRKYAYFYKTNVSNPHLAVLIVASHNVQLFTFFLICLSIEGLVGGDRAQEQL